LKLARGTYIKDQWASWGVTVTAVGANGSGYTPLNQARIFDTANPGTNNDNGDADLGSPNIKCIPLDQRAGRDWGIGLGGEPGQPGENCSPVGNIAIIQESDKVAPDDNGGGGSIIYTFSTPVLVESVGLMDMDEVPEEIVLKFTDGTTSKISYLGLGDNSVQWVNINRSNVMALTVIFRASGATTGIRFCNTQAPTKAPTWAPTTNTVTYPCALPSGSLNYALITSGNAKISAHTVYRAVHVGGTLTDGTTSSDTIISSNYQNQASWVNTLGSPVKPTTGATLEIKGGYTTGGTGVLNFAAYEWLARNAKSSTSGSYKVVVMTTGGTFNTYSFNNGGQGYDNGNTLVIFNTTADIILDKTSDGRQFGPSVIAPFSKVTLKGQAGFVDGLVVAREFTDDNNNAGSLQMHASGYKGPITCI
jgi:hypothetical protein